MMIASALHLDRRAVKALKITDLYSLHRVVYSLYPDVRTQEEKQSSTSSGILFADQGGDHTGRRILLLSNREPRPCVDGDYGAVIGKEIDDNFLSFKAYRFKVIINPTRRDSKSRKLIPVKTRDEIAVWFAERAASSWGFDAPLEFLQVDAINVHQFADKVSRPITIAQAHVQGLLNVVDPERFRKCFADGIGRARGYGCGLLQIVPLKVHTSL